MRHVLTAQRRRCAAVAPAFLVLLALLSGCSRDLALPSPPTSPALTGFSPTAAYAGQLVRVTGTHFDADPAGNTVNFAHGSVRGIRFDGEELVARVPADAGDGAITVANRDGTSEPSATPFDYLGLGQPRRGQVVSSAPILHHPRRVHSVYYSTFLESPLYGSRDGTSVGLVGYGSGSKGPDPFVSATAAAPWRNLLVYTVDDATGTNVTIVDEVDGTWKTVRLEGVKPWRIVPVRGPTLAQDQLVSFQKNAALEETMAVWNLDGLRAATPITAPIEEGVISLATPEGTWIVAEITGPVDTGDGRIAAVASVVGAGSALGIALIDFRGRPDQFFLPPSGRTIEASTSDRYFDGLAAGVRGTGRSSALAFALDGGRVGYFDLDWLADPAPPSSNVEVRGTYSAAPVKGLAISSLNVVTGQVLVIATKPEDDLVLGIDFSVALNSVLWGLPTAGAARLTVDHYLSSVVWVANDRDNEVQVVNAATGRQVGRISFDVAPTSIGASTGLAFSPADPLDFATTDELYLFAGNPAGVLIHPLGFGQQSCAWRPPAATALVRDPASRVVWGASAGSASTDPMEIANLSGVQPALVAATPPGQPMAAAFAGGSFVVGHDGGLTAFAGTTATGTWAPTLADPAYPPVWYSLGAAPTGELFAAGSWDLVDRVQLWLPADITSTGAPLAGWSPGFDYVDWAAWLEDGLWVQHTDYATWTVSRLALSGSSLVEEEKVTPVEPFGLVGMLIGPTPNGRALVAWENRFGGGSALRLFSADPATAFAETMYVALEGTVVGVAFDSSGEHAFVVTRGPDRIVTID
jgi:hypothetical protein